MVKEYDFDSAKYYPPGERAEGKDSSEKKGASSGALFFAAVLLAAVLLSLVIFTLCITDVIDMDRKEDESPISIHKRTLGRTADGEKIYSYRLSNAAKMEVEVLNLGGIISTVKVTDKDGSLGDVVLGFHKLEGYQTNVGNKDALLGAIIGQVAGPISDAQFKLGDTVHNLTANAAPHHQNGGNMGWDKVVWKSERKWDYIRLTHNTTAGTEGYPGMMQVAVTVQLTEDSQLVINITAVGSASTIINPTSNICFNMAGEGSGSISEHEVTLFSDSYLETTGDDISIPTGSVRDVTDTMYDLRGGVKLESIFTPENASLPTGIDKYFLVRGASGKRKAVSVTDTTSGRQVTVYTDQPGVRFYTGDKLDITGGKWSPDGNHNYKKHSGFCINSMNYPDAINQPTFPDSVLEMGSTYMQSVWYSFSIVKPDS